MQVLMMFLLYTTWVQKNDSIVRSFFTLNKAARSFGEIPVTEKDRGSFGIRIAFIRHNQEYTNDLTFNVLLVKQRVETLLMKRTAIKPPAQEAKNGK